MSEQSNVVDLFPCQPKRITGTRRNADWTCWYDPQRREWRYEVVVHLAPHQFGGKASTQAEALAQAHSIVQAAVEL